MQTKIQVLDEKTINKIAAGEVVEDPASVVKELLENALDAGAKRICVEIKAGGLGMIRVSDDGMGMSKDNALLCLERHATSKISDIEDLNHVATMGFRGEALSSIGAVSELTLETHDGTSGTKIEMSGGRIKHISPIGRGQGTTMTILSLFYNVPARRKFQKSPRACLADIAKLLTRLTLTCPKVHITLISEEEEIFCKPPATFIDRAKELLGIDGLREVEFEDGECKISGLIGEPHLAKTNRSRQYLIVNHRLLTSKEIQEGVYAGYATRLSSKEHPVFALEMQLPKEEVDVNVHPQKRVARFFAAPKVMSLAKKGVEKAFNAITPIDFTPSGNFVPSEFPLSLQEEEEESHEVEEELDFYPLGLFAHFLLLKAENFLMVHLPRAYSRVVYDAIIHEKEERQMLLLPKTFSFPPHEASAIALKLEELCKLGVGIREFGDNTFIVDSLISSIHLECVEEILSKVVGEENLTKLVSLHAKKWNFTFESAVMLYRKLLLTDEPYRSIDGKAIMVQMSRDACEKLFT